MKSYFFTFVTFKFGAKEQNYATYKYKNYITLRRDFGAKPTFTRELTEFDHYCLHSYAFGEKTDGVTKDFNVIYL